MREKQNELEEKDEIIETHVKTESENLEKIRLLTVEVKDKDDLLQTALAQVESEDISAKNNVRLKEKDLKIARYGSYITKIKALKYKQGATPSDAPVNDIIAKLAKEKEDLNTKSEESFR